MCQYAVNNLPDEPFGQFIDVPSHNVWLQRIYNQREYTTFHFSPIETPAFCPPERNK